MILDCQTWRLLLVWKCEEKGPPCISVIVLHILYFQVTFVFWSHFLHAKLKVLCSDQQCQNKNMPSIHAQIYQRALDKWYYNQWIDPIYQNYSFGLWYGDILSIHAFWSMQRKLKPNAIPVIKYIIAHMIRLEMIQLKHRLPNDCISLFWHYWLWSLVCKEAFVIASSCMLIFSSL